MSNDDYLNDFLANSAYLDMWLSRDTAAQLRAWLEELLSARQQLATNQRDGDRAQRWIEYAATLGQRSADLQQRLASLRQGAQFYVERNQRLMEENRQLLAQYDEAIREKWELQVKLERWGKDWGWFFNSR